MFLNISKSYVWEKIRYEYYLYGMWMRITKINILEFYNVLDSIGP